MDRNSLTNIAIIAVAVLSGINTGIAGGGLDPFVVNTDVPNAAVATVRDLVNSGQARYQVVERRILNERTEIELVLTDLKGQTIGGYAPPCLQSEESARALWKNFVTVNLAISSSADQISVLEHRKSESESFAVSFVLDHSPSMTIPRAIRMQKAVQQALATFSSNDYVSVVKFTGRVTTEVELTRDRAAYLSGFKVSGLNLRSDGTAIYDGAAEGLKQLASAPSATKRILIVFTDGEDNSSSTDFEEVLEEAKKTNTVIHTIVYGVANDVAVSRLSKETGGKNFRLNDVYDFDRVFLGIYVALRHSYVLTINTKGHHDVESATGGVMTAVGTSSGSIRTNEMMVLLPRHNVEVSRHSTDATLVMNVGLTFDANNGEVEPDYLALLDSVATVMVQRSDIALDIVSSTESQVGTQDDNDRAQRQVRSVRELLIRRGISPVRIQGYANRTATTNPILQRVASNSKTTFVFTKL